MTMPDVAVTASEDSDDDAIVDPANLTSIAQRGVEITTTTSKSEGVGNHVWLWADHFRGRLVGFTVLLESHDSPERRISVQSGFGLARNVVRGR